MKFTRRAFVLTSGAVVGLPAWARFAWAAPPPREADIAVVGAGAAGIAAARRVLAAGRSVVVVEATGQIGGRCLTDAATFGVPFDRGARWLYNPDSNPVARLARPLGFEITPAPRGQRLRIGRRNARAGEMEDFLAALVRVNRAIGDAARGKADSPCLDALPKDLGEWRATAEFVLGPLGTGKDLKDISVMDFARAAERSGDSFCRQGLGALLTKLAAGVPVATATPATRIVWSNRGAEIETPAGRIAARAVIVTASTNVLAAGRIKFSPELPRRVLDAAARLGLGSSDRIALELPGNPLGLARDDVVIEQSNGARTGALLANVGGSSLCTVEVAGGFGRELSAQGEAAMVAFATEWLGRMYGSDIAASVRRTAVTQWNAMPYVLGARSVAAPGGQPSRKILGEPLGALSFAGEATHETLWGTVGGAWESGERAAEAALRRIGALKPEPAAATTRRKKKRNN
ncbi:MAG: FAD-dependent oxidoreductase [Xanthobacteraceae bacterium]|nr:MAG: FAD-dependent oxidoreductase [Xanthobacteraceae bacterium]